MKKFVLLNLILFVSSISYAQSSQILRCKVENTQWVAVFELDAVADGFLKFKRSGVDQEYTCGLRLDYINDGQRNVVPEVTVEFTRGSCAPDLTSELGQEILTSFTLFVNLNNMEKPAGRVQWLRRSQPEACVVETFKMFDIQLNAKKWQDGKWGRKTASDPKQNKKGK